MSGIYEKNMNIYGNNHLYPVNSTAKNQMATGTHTMVIKSNADAIKNTEKSSFHNPITGISEKIKIKTKQEKRNSSNSSSERDKSRSSSEERKMRNLAYQDQLDAHRPIGEYCQMPVGNLPQPVHASELGAQQISRKKVKVTTKGDRIITKEKLYFKDPLTVREENTKVTTETKDLYSNDDNQKSQTSYDYKIKNTPNGPEEVMKIKHREGGIRENMRNKLQNIMNNPF